MPEFMPYTPCPSNYGRGSDANAVIWAVPGAETIPVIEDHAVFLALWPEHAAELADRKVEQASHNARRIARTRSREERDRHAWCYLVESEDRADLRTGRSVQIVGWLCLAFILFAWVIPTMVQAAPHGPEALRQIVAAWRGDNHNSVMDKGEIKP